MKTLQKHILQFDKSFDFFKESLGETNTLSNEILKLIGCSRGYFFTLLPTGTDLTGLHQFNKGILPKMPLQRGPVGSLKGAHTYEKVSSLEEEICYFILKKTVNTNMCCVFDDFNSSYKEGYCYDLFDKFGFVLNNEIYFILKDTSISNINILNCLYKSKTFWHSLFVLTSANISDITNKNITKKEISEICEHAQYVGIIAYDGDGYILWEKEF